MALKLYDIEIDDTREPTQEDIDRLTAVQQAYGKLRALVAQTHAEMLVEIERFRRRHRAVVDVPDKVILLTLRYNSIQAPTY